MIEWLMLRSWSERYGIVIRPIHIRGVIVDGSILVYAALMI